MNMFVIVGHTDGDHWPVAEEDFCTEDAVEARLKFHLECVLGDMSETHDIQSEAMTELDGGAEFWSYSEDRDPHGGTVAWAIAIVRLPFA